MDNTSTATLIVPRAGKFHIIVDDNGWIVALDTDDGNQFIKTNFDPDVDQPVMFSPFTNTLIELQQFMINAIFDRIQEMQIAISRNAINLHNIVPGNA